MVGPQELGRCHRLAAQEFLEIPRRAAPFSGVDALHLHKREAGGLLGQTRRH